MARLVGEEGRSNCGDDVDKLEGDGDDDKEGEEDRWPPDGEDAAKRSSVDDEAGDDDDDNAVRSGASFFTAFTASLTCNVVTLVRPWYLTWNSFPVKVDSDPVW